MPGFALRSSATAGVLVLAIAGCASSVSGARPAGTKSGRSTSSVAGSQIVISNFAYSPMNLTVAPGQTVRVVNHDSTAHTLTAGAGNAFDTGTIDSRWVCVSACRQRRMCSRSGQRSTTALTSS